MHENLSTRKCHMGLDARKFCCAKISTFTVFNILRANLAQTDFLIVHYMLIVVINDPFSKETRAVINQLGSVNLGLITTISRWFAA